MTTVDIWRQVAAERYQAAKETREDSIQACRALFVQRQGMGASLKELDGIERCIAVLKALPIPGEDADSNR